MIVQGIEAGGHVRGTRPLQELLASMSDKIAIPVVAAGGIATAEHVGRQSSVPEQRPPGGQPLCRYRGVWAHPVYVAALVDARSAQDTVLTTVFSGGWPDAPYLGAFCGQPSRLQKPSTATS